MKTTIELPDELSRDAKRFAREHGVTLRELIERGLRRELRGAASMVEFHWLPVVGGEEHDPMPARPPHEYAYDES